MKFRIFCLNKRAFLNKNGRIGIWPNFDCSKSKGKIFLRFLNSREFILNAESNQKEIIKSHFKSVRNEVFFN